MGVSGLAGLALPARAKRFRHRSASLRQAGQLSSFLFRAYSRNFFPWQRECDATYYPISSCIKKRRQRFMQIMQPCINGPLDALKAPAGALPLLQIVKEHNSGTCRQYIDAHAVPIIPARAKVFAEKSRATRWGICPLRLDGPARRPPHVPLGRNAVEGGPYSARRQQASRLPTTRSRSWMSWAGCDRRLSSMGGPCWRRCR